MPQIAFVTWNGGGNLAPTLAIAAQASPARPPRRRLCDLQLSAV